MGLKYADRRGKERQAGGNDPKLKRRGGVLRDIKFSDLLEGGKLKVSGVKVEPVSILSLTRELTAKVVELDKLRGELSKEREWARKWQVRAEAAEERLRLFSGVSKLSKRKVK